MLFNSTEAYSDTFKVAREEPMTMKQEEIVKPVVSETKQPVQEVAATEETNEEAASNEESASTEETNEESGSTEESGSNEETGSTEEA
jgi:hypothetical protein